VSFKVAPMTVVTYLITIVTSRKVQA